ncbi:MAG: hypothetical protein KDA22_14315 [Phycisphaerales bacterium]|nr:hypothetical protein [Phycisphaerales bacterium]
MTTSDPAPIPPDGLEIVRRFAVALDREDYPAARALVDAGCVYSIRGRTLCGPDAIVGSYQSNGDAAAQKFDAIAYGSSVAPGTDGWIVITFTDRIRHAGKSLEHVCEQWVRLDAQARIVRIEHHDLPGERERLEAFKRSVGL